MVWQALALAAPGAPWVGRLLPRGVRHIDEDKRRARGTLTVGGVSRDGWVIHERITWT